MKNNPLAIIPLIFRSVRPSRTDDMPALALPFWIKKGYEALTFFGHIITHTRQEADCMNSHYDALKNHEMIHLYQARSTGDSWLCFYWLYLMHWLRASRYRCHLKNAGYWLNPFEMEAYRHMDDLQYLSGKHEATEWRQLARLSLKERLQLWKQEHGVAESRS